MYKVVIDYAPSQSDNDVVGEGIFASYKNIAGERDKPFSIFLKDDSGKIFGGIQAYLDRQSVRFFAWSKTDSLSKSTLF